MSTTIWSESKAQISGPARPGALVGVEVAKEIWDTPGEGWEYHLERGSIALDLAAFKESPDWALVRSLTRSLKRTMRCGSSDDLADAKGRITEGLTESSDEFKEVHNSYNTPFGGYVIALPYADGPNMHKWTDALRGVFRDMGLAKHEGFERRNHISIKTVEFIKVTSKSDQRRRFAKLAEKNDAVFRGTDIVAVSGHHYTSWLTPGVFTDIDTLFGFDLRYSLKVRPSGYPNVRLFVAAGCSAICSSGHAVLRATFPNALIVGSRATMTKGGGGPAIREFKKACLANGSAFLLDNLEDLDAIAEAWRRGATHALADMTGYAAPGSSWKDTVKVVVNDNPYKLEELEASDPNNACAKKKDGRKYFPAPNPK